MALSARVNLNLKLDGRMSYDEAARSQELAEVEDMVRLRRNINNILDWGLLRRRLEIKEDLKALKERVGERGAESHARRRGRG